MRGKALSMSMLLLAVLAVAAAPAAAQTPAPASRHRCGPGPAPAPPAATGGAAYGVVFQPTVPGLRGPDRQRRRLRARPGARPGQAGHLGRQPDRRDALPPRRRPQARLHRPRLRLLGHRVLRAARRRPAGHAARLVVVHALRRRAAQGQWITVYTNPGHAFAVIAGLRLDTSAAGDPAGGSGPRWRPNLRSTRGYKARHPVGL